MNAQFQVAQATGSSAAGSNSAIPVRIFKLTKPLTDQAVTVNLGYDQKVQLDFTSIANEKITLVHVGERLIILFDNKSTVTVEPFFDSRHDSLKNLTIEVAPGREVSVNEFASLFPISTDQSVLPAAGEGGNAQGSGANFSNPTVDPINAGNPLPLLGPEELGNWRFTPETFAGTPDEIIPISASFTISGVLLTHDETLDVQNVAGANDQPNAALPGAFSPVGLIGWAQSADPVIIPGVIDFGSGGTGTVAYALTTAAGTGFNGTPTGLHATATGNELFLYTLGNLVVAREGSGGLANPAGAIAFELYLDANLHLNVAQYEAISHGDTTQFNELASLANVLFVQQTVTDGIGNVFTSVSSGTLGVAFLDDGPTITRDGEGGEQGSLGLLELDETIGGEGSPQDRYNGAETESNGGPSNGTADDTGVSTVTVSTAPTNGQAIGEQSTSNVAGALLSLFPPAVVNFGTDGPGTVTNVLSFVLSNTTVGTNLTATALHGTSLEGMSPAERAIELVQIDANTIEGRLVGDGTPNNGDEFVAFRITLVDPTLPTAHIVVDQFLPIDHDGSENPSVFDEQALLNTIQGGTLGLQLVTTVTDGDGDHVSSPVEVTIIGGEQTFISFDDDGPILNDASVTAVVDEDGLPGHNEDTGQSGETNTGGGSATYSGSLASLVDFGTDGPDAAGFKLVSISAPGSTGLTSKTEAILVVSDGTTLHGYVEAGAGGAGFQEGSDREIFTLTVDADGNYTFTLKDQIDHPVTGSEDSLTIDLSGYVIATDGDGDSVTLGSGSFSVDVWDDIPIVTGTAISRTVDEDDIKTPWSHGTSPNDGSADGSTTEDSTGAAYVSGTLSGLVSVGADEPGTFHFSANAVAAMEALHLFSKQTASPENGVALTYAITHVGSNWILTATEPNIAGSGNTGNPVFSLTINENTGAYEFRLFDELIHVPPAANDPDHQDQNTALRSGGPGYYDNNHDGVAHSGSTPVGNPVPYLDFGSIITFTDRDNDSVTLTGKFTITVTDDVPQADIDVDCGSVTVDETPGNQADDTTSNSVKAIFAALESSPNFVIGHDPDVPGDHNGGGLGNGYGAIAYAQSDNAVVVDDSVIGADSPPYAHTFSLSIAGGADSGLRVTDGGQILLSKTADGLIIGTVSDPNSSFNGQVAFAIAIGSDGKVSVAQYLSIQHDDRGDPNETNDDGHDSHDASPNDPLTIQQTLDGKIIATLTVTDSDGDQSTDSVNIGKLITFLDDGPSVDSNYTVVLEDDDLPGGIDGGPNDDSAPQNASGTLDHDYGADGPGTTLLTGVNLPSGQGFTSTLSQDGRTLLIKQNGTDVLEIKLTDATSGQYTVTQLHAIDHPTLNGQNGDDTENNLIFTVNYRVTDGDGDFASGTLKIDVDDDTPEPNFVLASGKFVVTDETSGPQNATSTPGVPGDSNDNDTLNAFPVSVSNPGTPPTGSTLIGAPQVAQSAGAVVAVTPNYGADGPGSIQYSIDVPGGSNAASGLTTTSGKAITLFEVNDNLVVGRYDANGNGISSSDPAAFAIYINPTTGVMSVIQYVPIKHDDAPNDFDEDNDPSNMQQWITNSALRVTVTVTDHDGDSVDKTYEIGNKIVFEDDGPSASIVINSGVALTVDETDGVTANANETDPVGGNLGVAKISGASLFTETISYGADGQAASNAKTYSLVLSAGATGLTDTASGSPVVLVKNGAVIEGHAGNSNGPTVFTVSINSTNGEVTLTQLRAVVHGNPNDPDESTTPATLNPDLIGVKVTVTDGDSDSTSATAYLNNVIKFEDDGPTAVTSATAVSGSVEEDGMTLPSAANEGYNTSPDTQDGNKQPGDTSTDDQVQGLAGSLAPLVNFGSDGPAAGGGFSIVTTGFGSLPTLYSGGQPVVYSSNGSTLTATNSVGQVVFTLTVNADGSWQFDLDGQLDHVDDAGNGENTLLRTNASGTTSVGSIDFSSIIVATDKDGDHIDGLPAGKFAISVQDDIPTIAAPNAALGPNLILNGSFEDLAPNGPLADGNWGLYSSIANWKAGDGTAFELQAGNIGGLTPFDGHIKVELDGDTGENPGGGNGSPTPSTHATIQQTVTTVAGQVYQLSFYYSPRPDDGDGDSSGMQVLWNGNVVHTLDGATPGWQQIVLNVTGTGSDTLAFRGFGAGEENELGAFLDVVSLQAIGAVVVDEDGLPTGNHDSAPGDDQGQLADDAPLGLPANEATATGALGIVWGADAVDTGVDAKTRAFGGFVQDSVDAVGDRSVTFAGAVAPVGLTSHGAQVSYWVSPDGTFLVAYTGAPPLPPAEPAAVNRVFEVSLSDDGSGAFRFVLLGQLDHAPGQVENNLSLTFGYVATDSDSDSVSGSFTVNVDDDMPKAASATAGYVDEDDLTGPGHPGNHDVAAGDNLPNPSPVSVSGSFGIGFGADGPAASNAISGVSFTPGVTSDGLPVSMFYDSGTGTWYGRAGGAGGDNVFSLTFNTATGNYTFTLLDNLDHPVAGTEDNIVLNFSFTATDFDGDTATGSFSIDVDDDLPVTSAPTNLIVNGDFVGGSFNGQEDFPNHYPWGDNGHGGIDTNGIEGWTVSGPGGQVERVGNNYLGMTTSNGNPMIDMAASPGNITLTQTISGLTAGDYVIQFEAGTPVSGTALLEVVWNGVVVATINPPVDSMAPFNLAVTAVNGANTLAFREIGLDDSSTTGITNEGGTNGHHGTYLANVGLIQVATVDEDGLTLANSNGHADGVGDSNQIGDAPTNSPTVTQSLGIQWGADDNDDAADVADIQDAPGATGDRSLTFTNAAVTIGGVSSLTSNSDPVVFQVVDNGTRIVGYVNEGAGDGTYQAGTDRLVLDVTLSDDGSGSFTFTLHDNLDHAPGANENDLSLSFNYTAKDSDGDTATGSFVVAVDDDMPVVDLVTLEGAEIRLDETNGGDGGVNQADDTTSDGFLAQVTVNGSALFVASPLDFGADGPRDANNDGVADTTAKVFSLNIGNANSGLFDTATGQQVILSPNGSSIEGKVGNDVVFSIAVDPATGDVTVTQYRAVQHDDPADPDESNSPATMLAGRVTISVTLTDDDGDTATDSLDLGSLIKFEDDGPTASATAAPEILDDEKQWLGIDGGPGDQTGANLLTTSGTLAASGGSDGIKSFDFASASLAVTNSKGLTGNSLSIIFVDPTTHLATTEAITTQWFADGSGGGTLYGRTSGGHYDTIGHPAFTLTVDSTGHYVFTANAPLSHPFTDPDFENDGTETEFEDELTLNFTYKVTDGDNDTATATLSIIVDDDTPDLGEIDSIAASNGPATYVQDFVFLSGADGIGTVHFTPPSTDLTSGGVAIQYTENGNVLIAHTGNPLDPVFTLTLDLVAGTSTFQQFKPFDGTMTTVGIDGSTAHGTGPQELVVLNAAGTDVAILSGWQADSGFAGAVTQVGVKGSTAGWGVGNDQNFNGDDFFRFDFQDADTFGGTLTPPAFNGPEVTTATYQFTNFGGGPQTAHSIQYKVHYSDGSDSGAAPLSETWNGSTHDLSIVAPSGKQIDYIEMYANGESGGGKVDLVSVKAATTVIDLSLDFGVKITDGDGDAVDGNIHVGIADHAPTVTVPSVGSDGTVVDEKGLPDGSGELADAIPDNDNSETTTGSFSYTAGDGATTIKIGNVVLNPGTLPQVFHGTYGDLTVTSVTATTVNYTYTLLDNTLDHDNTTAGPPAGDRGTDDQVFDQFAITVSDSDGDTDAGTLTIAVNDDGPVAVNDGPAGVIEDGTNFVSGNVLSNDVSGADTPKSFVAWDAATDAATVTALNTYGTLVQNSNGTWSYTLDNSRAATQALTALSDTNYTLHYTMQDADGDQSAATLTINIKGANDSATVVTASATGADATVFEAGLNPDGSNFAASTETTTGSFTVSATDGIQNVVIGGTVFTLAQVLAFGTTNGTVNTGEGVLTLNGYTGTSSSGTINFSYTLSATIDNDSKTPGPGESVDGTGFNDSVVLTVNGIGGTTASDNLVIRAVDDTPTANNDGPAGVVEDGTNFVSGNVLTNDVSGADTPKSFVAWDAATDAATVTALNTYGTLVQNSNGTWSYTLDNSRAATQALTALSDTNYTLHYTMQDADGDQSAATLTINIRGANDSATVVTASATGADATVFEAGLNPDGSNFAASTETTTGSFTVSATDGIQNVVIGGTVFTLAQVLAFGTTNGTVNTGEGVLTLNGYTGTSSSGTINFSYTLSATIDNDSKVPTGNDSVDPTGFNDSVVLTVNGIGGTTASDNLVIRAVDDTPTANNDGPANVVEDGTSLVSGNVLTNDVSGADTPKAFVAWSGADTATIAALNTYGTLVQNNDGTWSYTLNNSLAATQALTAASNTNYTLHYTMQDADGDTSPATLTINIRGANDSATVVTAQATGADATVYEAGLNPNGSNAAATTETTTGSFTVSASDGIQNVVIGGTTFTLAQVQAFGTTNGTVNTGEGTLTLTGYTGTSTSGTINFSYTLSATIDNDSKVPTGNDSVDPTGFNDSVVLTVNGIGGTTASDNLVIRAVDDTPTANNDGPANVVEDGTSLVSGNVLTNDTSGADTPKAFLAWSGADTATIAALNTYGTLVQNNDGTWSYTLNNSLAATQALTAASNTNYTLHYTMQDADGDQSSATLTINIKGANDSATVVTAQATGADATVYEAGLNPNGSNAAATTETTTGSFTVSATDGIQNVVIGGTVFTLAQILAFGTTPGVVNTGEGTLTLTGYTGTSTSGTISFSYTLSATIDNDSKVPTGNDTVDGTGFNDSVALTVNGIGGTTASDNLVIRAVDDTPTARPDTDNVGTGTTAAGNVITDNAAGDIGDTDTNAADTAGADGAFISAIKSDNPGGSALTNVGTSVTINGQYGSLLIEADGDYSYTRFGSAVSAGTDTFTYTLKDGDGDTSTATLTITLADTGTLVVGSNDNDDGIAPDPAHTVPGPSPLASTGPVNGLAGNDILVGDPGGTAIAAGDNANIVLVLDRSGSMDDSISFGGGTITRLQAMKNAVNALIDSLSDSGANSVTVHIVTFDTNSGAGSTFTLVSGGAENGAQVTAAHNYVNGITSGSSTNYEAGLQSALDWINGTSANDPTPGASVNRLLFVSDGEPNRAYHANGTSTVDSVSSSEALEHLTGTYNESGSSDDDTVSEIARIETDDDGAGVEQAFTIEAVGINVGATAKGILDQVEGTGGNADNIDSAEELTAVIGNLISNSSVPTVAGSDIINGNAGNDVIFGDVLFTDTLADTHGLTNSTTTPNGAGWLVFQQLEAHLSTLPAYQNWTRADTLNYIQTHQAELAQESGRTGGNDTINGGAGDDVIYAQEGNDTTTYNVGDGRDFVDGGSGNDTLIVQGDANTQNFFLETVASYNTRIGPDYTGTAEALVSDGSGTIMVELDNIESVTINGGGGADTLTVSGDFSGTSILNSTIVFNGDAGNDTLDLTNRVDNRRVVADGGADVDTVKLSFAYSEVTGVVAVTGGFQITHDGITDTITNFENYQFSDVTLTYTALTAAPGTPSITSVTDNVPLITGTVASGGTTNDTDLVVRVSLAGTNALAGDKVQLFNLAAALGAAVVLTPADITNSYVEITTPTLANATTYALNAKVLDLFGSTSGASANYNVTIDTSAPAGTPTISSVNDDAAPTTGNVANGARTNDAALQIVGTGTSGNTVEIYDGATLLGTTAVVGSNWSFTTPSLSDGAHSFTARYVDAAGNEGTSTAARTVIVDTTPPSAPAITSVTDNVTPVTGTVASGDSTNDTTLVVRVSLTGTGALANDTVQLFNSASTLGSAVILSASNISAGFVDITTPTLTNGTTYNINAKITDVAGNGTSAASANHAVTVDTTAPTVTVAIVDASLNDGDPSSVVNFTFSEAPTGFTESDVSVVGGTLSGFSGSGTNYSATFTATDGFFGTGSVSVVAGSYTDVAGNAGTAGSDAVAIDRNAAPVGVADHIYTNASNSSSGTVLALQSAWLVKNDTDAEGDAITVESAATGTNVNQATGTATTTTIRADVAQNGTGTFTYVATDGAEDSTSITVTVHRGASDSAITGSSGNDILFGVGAATLDGGAGADFVTGGSNADILIADSADYLLDGGGGADKLQIGANFTSTSDGQIVNIETIELTAVNTILDLSNQTEGFKIIGSSGIDAITGGAGDDLIIAGAGNDTLRGNGGADQFRLATNSGTDIILDYIDGTDKIGFLDNGSTGGGSVSFGATGAANTAGVALNSNDFNTAGSIANIDNGQTEEIYRITNALTNSQIATSVSTDANTNNVYVLVFNSDTGRGEIWFDTNWATTGVERVKVATLDNVDTLDKLNAITAADIVLYSSATDPIILDLDHNGVAFSPIENGVQFDINGDGAKDQIAWTANGQDGILALDVDGSGKIENGNELFTPTFAGGKFASGIAALASLDSNHDGVISREDQSFDKLVVWQDANHNGVSDQGELTKLGDLGIKSIDLSATKVSDTIDGQQVEANGTFTYADGSTGTFVEVNFDTVAGSHPESAANTSQHGEHHEHADHQPPVGGDAPAISHEAAASILADFQHSEHHIDLSALGHPGDQGGATAAGGEHTTCAGYAPVPAAVLIAQEQAALAAATATH